MKIYTNPRSPLMQVVESFKGEGVTLQEAKHRGALKIAELVEQKDGIDPSSVTFNEMFNALVWQGNEDKINLDSAVSVSEAITSSDFSMLLSRIAKPRLLSGYDREMVAIQELITEIPEPVNNDYQIYNRITGAEGPELVKESTAYETTGMGEYEVMIRNNKFGRIIEVTREMILFDRTGQVMANLGDFGELMGLHRSRMVLECAAGMPSTATGLPTTQNLVLNGTGYAPYATTHATLPGSGGYANRNWYSTVPLNTTNLSTVLTYFRKLVDINGDYLNIFPTHLLIPPELEYAANKMYNEGQNPNATVANDMNVYRGKFKPVVWAGYTNATRYWLGKFAKQVYWQWNWRPQVEVTSDPSLAIKNDIVTLIKSSYNGGCGLVDHRFAMMLEN